ncbi:16S rRNA (cytosine(1402)-N(4))-methyltransferase RsmH [Candidatus Curtissbacteria bacterium]|nr:16S rRNA (cytosine(1402)-N(4))-methyltransferase RsmH [Candidatus Curtissbacteria bacterium]
MRNKSNPPAGGQVFHKSVLLHQILKFLNPEAGDLMIDATVGGAGHAKELTARGARVLGIDRDPEAIRNLERMNLPNMTLVRGNFADIGKIAQGAGFKKVRGIVFDLGVSSHQLETPERGFSFQAEGPLDMRMDPDLTIAASDIVNHFEERRLYEILKTFAQEKYSRRIARSICRARKVKPIETTTELASIIEAATRKWGPQNAKHFGVYKRGVFVRRIHPATKTFQALRIVVNSELLNLEEALPQTVDLLKVGGRLAIISFHSLEDGLVKRFLKKEAKLRVLTPKPIGPTKSEITENPRARSAKLRVAEKIQN